jgi:hypothetical protein
MSNYSFKKVEWTSQKGLNFSKIFFRDFFNEISFIPLKGSFYWKGHFRREGYKEGGKEGNPDRKLGGKEERYIKEVLVRKWIF